MIRRLGVFGGAFDPPHLAHVALAQAALEQLQLDELRIFPTGQAWHRSQQLTAPEHRLALTQIAFGGLTGAVIDDREMRRSGPTYTVDTLRELKAEQPQAELLLVIGEDQAVSLTRWREWESIVRLAVICVAGRALDGNRGAPPGLPAQAQVRMLRLPSMSESATEVRARVGRGEGIAHLVTPGVASYIEQHHLYQPN